MRKDIESKVVRFYKERQDYYKKLIEDGIAEAKKDEAILALDSRIKEIKVLTLKGENTPDIDNEYVELVSRYRESVKGYLPNIKYECPICKDRGVVGDKYCSCFMNRYYRAMREILNVDTIPPFTFGDNAISRKALDDDTKKKYATLYSDMEEFADNYPDVPKRNILLSGQAGSGKTCLVSAIANRLIDRNVAVQYITAFDLGEMMLRSHLDYKDTSLTTVTNVDVLIIDDLGTEPMRKNVNLTYLQSILDSRIAHGRSTIVTTNLTIEQLMARYGERIISRLMNGNTTIRRQLASLPNLRLIK